MNKKMTISEQVDGQRAHQALIRLDCEVRKAARLQGVDRADVEDLAARARTVFRVVNGEVRAFAADGKTVLRREDGGLLSISDWVVLADGHRAGHKANSHDADGHKVPGTFGPSAVALPEVKRNPFRRESWNLTEQMRLQRRDPELAARLRAEA